MPPSLAAPAEGPPKHRPAAGAEPAPGGPDGTGGGEARLLSGWGRTAPTRAQVHRPRRVAEVRTLLAGAGPRGVIARGLGRSYGDAAQNAGGRVVDTTGLAEVHALDPATGQATVGAGLSIGALAARTVPEGWFPPVTPGTRHVTVGGAIAADIHGKNHHREGGFCAHVRSFELETPAGERLAVTPDAAPDAFAATAGGMGLTGVVVEATVRLLAIETDRVRVDTERASDLDDVLARMESRDHAYRYSVAWIDCLARGRALGRSVLMRGDHARREELPERDRRAAPAFEPRDLLAAPAAFPSGLLRRATVRAFNEAWFRKAPREERGRLEPIGSFFYPLDGVRDWNRLYGGRGLLQYQLVVPFGAEDSLRAAVERMSAAGAPAFLGVLKRFGEHETGLISFPMPGWTLAVDLPAGLPELGPLLDGLDELVAGAGGRVYLAKDARMRPDVVEAMYPRLGQWREARGRLDPDGAMRSDLARRLALA